MSSYANTGGWWSIGRTRSAPRSAPLTDVIAAHLDSADPSRDVRTVFGVLLGGFHDVVLGRVDDVGEYAAYLYGFCAHGWKGR